MSCKIIKKLTALACACAFVLSLAGCSLSKDPITADSFKTAMEEKGYVVQDATDQFGGQVQKAYIAAPSDLSYQIEFYEVETESQAIGAFNQNQASFEERKGNGSVQTSSQGKNYQRFALTSGGAYMVVSQVDNTFLYADVPDGKKQEVSDLIKELGY